MTGLRMSESYTARRMGSKPEPLFVKTTLSSRISAIEALVTAVSAKPSFRQQSKQAGARNYIPEARIEGILNSIPYYEPHSDAVRMSKQVSTYAKLNDGMQSETSA